MTGEARVGAELTCVPPATWAFPPDRVVFGFVTTRFGAGSSTVQAGDDPTYVVREDDAGRLISCAATGVTAGGTATAGVSEARRVRGSGASPAPARRAPAGSSRRGRRAPAA